MQCEIDWWIFWGRVAGGFNRNQQTDIYQRLSGFLLPRGNKKPQRINASLLREMWRTASSLELLPVGTKTELGEALIKRVKAGDFKESELWCLSRLGARKLFYGPINLVVPPGAATRWVETLRQAAGGRRGAGRHGAANGRSNPRPARRDAARRSGASCRRCPTPSGCWRSLDGEEEDDQALGRIFGEELPSGLVLVEQAG